MHAQYNHHQCAMDHLARAKTSHGSLSPPHFPYPRQQSPMNVLFDTTLPRSAHVAVPVSPVCSFSGLRITPLQLLEWHLDCSLLELMAPASQDFHPKVEFLVTLLCASVSKEAVWSPCSTASPALAISHHMLHLYEQVRLASHSCTARCPQQH